MGCGVQPAVAQQQVDDQQQHHDAVTEDGADLQVAKTAAELLLESDTGKQRLVHHQAGERGQPLVFEFNLGDAMGNPYITDFGD